MNKEQLAKLASLDNAKTKKFLEDFALAEKTKIISAKTNEEIIERLELLHAIYYRVPKIVIWVINYLVYKAKPLPEIEKVTPLGKYSGTSHGEVIARCLDMAKGVRYFDIDKALTLSFDYIDNPNSIIAGFASKLLESTVDYNHQILPKIGFTPQIRAIAFLEKKLNSKKPTVRDLAFIKSVVQHILETSASISRMTSPDTLTLSSGDIVGHKYLARVRRQAIDFTLNLFERLDSAQDKSSIFILFEQACRMPMHSQNDSDLGKIIQKDRLYVAKRLTDLVFSGEKIRQPLAVCMHAEHLMHWFFIHMQLQQKTGLMFIKRLHKNGRYSLFSKFVYDGTYRYAKYDDIERDINKSVESYIAKINDRNKNSILKELNDVAGEAKNADEWKFLYFKQLLERLGQNKPTISFDLILVCVKSKNHLSSSYFLPFMLAGLRRARRFDLWDNAVDSILKTKHPEMISAIVGSLYMSHTNGTEPEIREDEDIRLLTGLVGRKKQFSIFKKSNNLLNFFTINALRVSYGVAPQEVEKLTITELKNHPEFFSAYMNNISIYSRNSEGFNLSDWSPESKQFLIERVITLPDLDWHVQSILDQICTPKGLVDLFIQRIKYKDSHLVEGENYFESPYRHYDPIPYHMNDELLTFIKSDPATVREIAKNLSVKHTVDSFELSQLIKNLHLDPRTMLDVLSEGTESEETVVKKVVQSLSSIDANDPDFLVELASKTSNKSVHDSLYGRLAATGVVSGEFGIADAYRRKWQAIEKYKDSENKNIRAFVNQSIERLKANEDHARKKAEQEKETRRIDFESNN